MRLLIRGPGVPEPKGIADLQSNFPQKSICVARSEDLGFVGRPVNFPELQFIPDLAKLDVTRHSQWSEPPMGLSVQDQFVLQSIVVQ